MLKICSKPQEIDIVRLTSSLSQPEKINININDPREDKKYHREDTLSFNMFTSSGGNTILFDF